MAKSFKAKKKKNNADRWRCLSVGCNPVLHGEMSATAHKEATEHRVAKWPVRSAQGITKADRRNKDGYYDKYNVGEKSYAVRVGEGYMADTEGMFDGDGGYDGRGWSGSPSFESGMDGHGQE